MLLYQCDCSYFEDEPATQSCYSIFFFKHCIWHVLNNWIYICFPSVRPAGEVNCLFWECAIYITPLQNVVSSFKLMTTAPHMKEQQLYALMLPESLYGIFFPENDSLRSKKKGYFMTFLRDGSFECVRNSTDSCTRGKDRGHKFYDIWIWRGVWGSWVTNSTQVSWEAEWKCELFQFTQKA